MIELVGEAVVVGVMVMVIGLVISYISMYIKSPVQANSFDHWWSVAISFALSGALVHIFCEATGMNRWYCKNGVACKKL